MHVLVLAFTIFDGNENPNSPSGNHIISMLNAQEKYEYLSQALMDIADEIQSVQTITVDGHEFNIEFYLGGDMKYLAICLGIQAANAKYSCIWCKCPAAKGTIPLNHGALLKMVQEQLKKFNVFP